MRRAVVSVLAHGTRFGRAATPSSAFASPAALRQFAHSTASAQCLAAPLLPRAAQALPASNTGSRAFSRSSAAGAAEESLPDVLNVELKHELEHYETPELVKQGPPSPFILSEEPGSSLLVLSRDFGDEEISISLSVDHGEGGDEWEDEGDDAAEAADGEEGENEPEDVTVFFDVTVSKSNDRSLTFECATDGINLDILNVALEDGADEGSEEPYTGPVFADLDEKLQYAFESYLQERGLDMPLLEYLVEISIDKEQREYVNWLKRTLAFVGKSK